MANPYMNGGRKSGATENPSGKGARGSNVRIGASKTGTMKVSSGSSGKALKVGGKQK